MAWIDLAEMARILDTFVTPVETPRLKLLA
jgi:hypothetical protein